MHTKSLYILNSSIDTRRQHIFFFLFAFFRSSRRLSSQLSESGATFFFFIHFQSETRSGSMIANRRQSKLIIHLQNRQIQNENSLRVVDRSNAISINSIFTFCIEEKKVKSHLTFTRFRFQMKLRKSKLMRPTTAEI